MFAMSSGFGSPFLAGVILESGLEIALAWEIVFCVAASISVFGAVFFIIFGSADVQGWDQTCSEQNQDIRERERPEAA